MTVKIAIAQMNSIVGDLTGNAAKILDLAGQAHAAGVDILVTPELSPSMMHRPKVEQPLLLWNFYRVKTCESL
jgi:NAD+ synthase (glutamine-hydrolysing)